jgi:putative tricarboxylic transport membrane protein
MTLERWLALIFLIFCLVYGYAAHFVMDDALPVFAKFSPVWPSSFPKAISVIGIVLGFMQLVFWSGKHKGEELDFNHLGQYQWKSALSIVALMIAYALLLRFLGFVAATILFISLSAFVLGERNFKVLIPISALTSFGIWYLVDQVLGIFLRPWPAFIYGGA